MVTWRAKPGMTLPVRWCWNSPIFMQCLKSLTSPGKCRISPEEKMGCSSALLFPHSDHDINSVCSLFLLQVRPTLSLPVILPSPVGVTLASFSGQGPSIFCNSLSPGTGCGTPPRPTLEALPRRSTSGCVCTRWTSSHCRGRGILSKSCYSVSPSTRSDLGCTALLLSFPDFPL